MNFFNQFIDPHLIAAHRGFRFNYPENTRCAFEAAVGRCDFIEVDIRLSRDNVPVIIHDATLIRTSNAATMAATLGKTTLQVADWRLAELRELDMGSWYLDEDPFNTIEDGIVNQEMLKSLMPQTIMTLDELLSWAVANKNPINIEMKDPAENGRVNHKFVEIVVDAIYRKNVAERVLLSSFNHEDLRHIRQIAPDLSTAALQKTAHHSDLIKYLHNLGVCAYHPSEQIINPLLVATLRDAGFIVNVFTVNDRKRQRELYELGVTMIITDSL